VISERAQTCTNVVNGRPNFSNGPWRWRREREFVRRGAFSLRMRTSPRLFGARVLLPVTMALVGCGGVSPAADDGASAPGTSHVETVSGGDADSSTAPTVVADGGVDAVSPEAVSEEDASAAIDANPQPQPDASSMDVGAIADAGVERPAVDAGVEVAVDVGTEVATDAGSESPPADAGIEAAVEVGARPCGLKINEIQTGGQTAADEFVELYNTCAEQPVSLAGWKLLYRSDVGTVDFVRVAFTNEMIVAGRPFFVCANVAFAGQADARFTDGLKAEGGGLALRAPDGKIVDSVGWGTATNAFVEGAPAPAPLPGQSIARTPDGVDTDDNATDFVVRPAAAATSPGSSNGPR
jgi:hypothetical protein